MKSQSTCILILGAVIVVDPPPPLVAVRGRGGRRLQVPRAEAARRGAGRGGSARGRGARGAARGSLGAAGPLPAGARAPSVVTPGPVRLRPLASGVDHLRFSSVFGSGEERINLDDPGQGFPSDHEFDDIVDTPANATARGAQVLQRK